MMIPVKNEYDTLRYLGRGPHENYIDRYYSADIGCYETKIKDLFVPYLKPQEYGERTGVRVAEIKGSQKKLTIDADSEIELNVSPYTAEELEQAPHAFELPESDRLYIRAVCRQMGVGGYDSWGAHTLEEHKNKTDRDYDYSYSIIL